LPDGLDDAVNQPSLVLLPPLSPLYTYSSPQSMRPGEFPFFGKQFVVFRYYRAVVGQQGSA
jgi:hypothetical protein